MLGYQIRIAIKSLRRTPILSLVMIGAIALGIAVSTTFVTTHHLLSMNPIPHKSDVLYNLQLDSWDPDRGWDQDDSESLPTQVTYRDMVGVMQSEIPTLQGGSFKASLYIYPEPEVGRPYKALSRMCFSDFFKLFDTPFRYGAGWTSSADLGSEQVVVLDDATNQKLFGGENSVGRLVRIENRDFEVVGVLRPWRPMPKFYDVHNGAYEEPESIYMPFELMRVLQIYSAGNTSSWSPAPTGAPVADLTPEQRHLEHLNSEAIWIQMWVQLDSRRQREAYGSFLRAYIEEQKRQGRMLRPTQYRLANVMDWLEDRRVVPEESSSLLLISLLFLVVCSLNLIGILLGKFLARTPEVSVRRAFGASRLSIFAQHVVECEVIGVLGGLLGIGLSVGALQGVNVLFGENFQFHLDTYALLAGVTLSLLAGLIAGLYPAWKICTVPPAVSLKEH